MRLVPPPPQHTHPHPDGMKPDGTIIPGLLAVGNKVSTTTTSHPPSPHPHPDGMEPDGTMILSYQVYQL